MPYKNTPFFGFKIDFCQNRQFSLTIPRSKSMNNEKFTKIVKVHKNGFTR